MLISLDKRPKDEDNPFSFKFRKEVLEDRLDNLTDRINIVSHTCDEDTVEGCLPNVYHNVKKFENTVDLVIGGPDMSEKAKDFWRNKNIDVKTVSNRFFDISATEVRKVFRAEDKGFSIITNFDCDNNCWYCVWENFHRLKDCQTTYEKTNWEKLDELLRWYHNDKINVSGGLEPLYDYKNNKKWWRKLFNVAHNNNKKVDIHTRKVIIDEELINNTNKFVVSFDHLGEVKDNIKSYYNRGVDVRLTKVITKSTRLKELYQIVEFASECNYQLTFKELYGFNDEGAFKRLKKKLKENYDFKDKKIKFLEHSDYNIYYMPDNKVYESFIIK